uniref:Uncharacterized protein n=1 Tax=Bursaphelenchus xylophilus TaxID=6326 RepID=A0A1I7SFH2_BURXY
MAMKPIALFLVILMAAGTDSAIHQQLRRHRLTNVVIDVDLADCTK